MKSFKIGNIKIGEKHNPIVVVEIGINHKGSLYLAIYMVDKAIKSGAQIIKHQYVIAIEYIHIKRHAKTKQ